MSHENQVDATGIDGSTSSTVIYRTPDYQYHTGVAIAHGQTTGWRPQGAIEFVDLMLPGISLRVRAEEVRPALDAFYVARSSGDVHTAFRTLQAAIWTAALPLLQVQHIEAIARHAFDEGRRDGQSSLQRGLRSILGLS